MKNWLLLIGCLYAGGAFAQTDQQLLFQDLAQAMSIDIYWPTESLYKERPVQANDYLDYQYALYSRKEKMEIRYFLQPENADAPMTQMPHIDLGRLLMHLGSNDEEVPIAVHPIEAVRLQEEFNADWGQVSFFPPKRSFAGDYAHCQMVSLYREGVGTAHVLFLFNTAPDNLRERQAALRFLPEVVD